MDRTISAIGDPETVPVRLEFASGREISRGEVSRRLEHLYRELSARLPSARPGVELGVVAHETNGLYLHIGWVAENEANIALDCIEIAFPEAITVHLGSDAGLGAKRYSTATRGESGGKFIVVPEHEVEFEDGRHVTVSSFAVSRAPVTVGEFLKFVGATGYITTAESQDSYETFRANALIDGLSDDEVRASHVAFVSKIDALSYCKWSRSRLPTEAEWLAAFVLDWNPLGPGCKPTAEQVARMKSAPVAGMAEWTGSVDDLTGQSIVRATPTYYLKHDWKERCGHRLCPDDHY